MSHKRHRLAIFNWMCHTGSEVETAVSEEWLERWPDDFDALEDAEDPAWSTRRRSVSSPAGNPSP
jgi:hypothetical protein